MLCIRETLIQYHCVAATVQLVNYPIDIISLQM
jgi:hypothetical protein